MRLQNFNHVPGGLPLIKKNGELEFNFDKADKLREDEETYKKSGFFSEEELDSLYLNKNEWWIKVKKQGGIIVDVLARDIYTQRQDEDRQDKRTDNSGGRQHN